MEILMAIWPGTRKPLEVKVCNPFIPTGAYRRDMALALIRVGQHVSPRKFKGLVHNKLRLEDPAPKEDRYLQAAVELTVSGRPDQPLPSPQAGRGEGQAHSPLDVC